MVGWEQRTWAEAGRVELRGAAGGEVNGMKAAEVWFEM
jgi:hypothetical protein